MTSIVTQARVEGQHRYEGAPPAVQFLAFPHRHEFHIRVEIEVFHTNRDIEIIMLKHLILQHFEAEYPKLNHASRIYNFETLSCETLAENLMFYLKGYYKDDDEADELGRSRLMSVQVLEDGENGAIIRESI